MSKINKELDNLLEGVSQDSQDPNAENAPVRIQLEGKKAKKQKQPKQPKQPKSKKGKKQDDQTAQAVVDADSQEVAIDTVEKKPKKEKGPNKISFYLKSIFKTYNLITLLPITCLLYVVFFAIDISDGPGISFFENNKLAMIIFMAIIGVALVVWAFITMRNKEVCSLDAFLLIGMLTGIGMLLQCFILGHFAPINSVAILTLIVIVVFVFLMTVRLALFKVHAQQESNDAKYSAKNKLGMYFKVVFTKYASFITMLVVFGIMIVFMLTREDVLEKFEYQATTLETIVTVAFAGAAVVMMVISLFIRLVRGRVNIVDCMPYIFYIVTIGSLIFFFTEQVYTFLYLAIACLVVGAVWLGVCQYTINVDLYRKIKRINGDEVKELANELDKMVEEIQEEEAQPVEDTQTQEPQEEISEEIEILSQNPDFIEEPIEEPVEEVAEEPVEEPVEEVAEEPVEEPVEEVAEEPVEEPVEEVAEEPVEEPVEEVVEEPVEEPVEEVTEEPTEQPLAEVVHDNNDEINERLANIETNIIALMNQNNKDDEEVEEEDEDEDDEEEVDIASVKSIRPRFTFINKLRLASDEIKDFYTQIKNELLSYGFRNRLSKTKENFNHSRDTKARLVINGKTMKLYLALDPTTLDEKYFHHKNVGDKKGTAEIPTAMPIRSKLAVKKAKELIEKLAQACELNKKPRFKDKDFSEELSAKDMTLTDRKGYGYLVKDSVSLEQAQQIPDELAEILTDVQPEETPLRFIKQTISLDDIVAQFDDGDVVTIETIREGGIGVQNANYLIVEDGTLVNKKLKVYADEITPNAIKMITLAGGEVYKIWRKR